MTWARLLMKRLAAAPLVSRTPNLQSGGAQGVDFLHQGKGIEDDAVADDRLGLLAQDAAGNQLQDKLFAGDGDGMPGVVSAGIARNNFEIIRKDIDDLALALITPLGSENHRGLCFAHSGLQTHADGLRKSRTQT